MADRRIGIAKDKEDFVKQLLTTNGTGPFSLQAEVLAFAAALGASRNRSVPLKETAKDPIRQDVFNNRGYDTLINLLAVHKDSDPLVLGNGEEQEEKRIKTFEEYANGGLEILQEELKGVPDYQKQIAQLIGAERVDESESAGAFDVSKLIE